MDKKRYLLMLECELHQWAKEFGGQQERSISYIVNRALRNAKAEVEKKQDKAAAQKSPAERVPSNFDEQFEILWSAKGRKGAKKTAREKMRGFCKGETAEDVEAFISMLVRDINEQLKSEVLGFADLHLTTYLNQERWEK